MAKKLKTGNTSSSQEIVENILAITNYETEIEVQVTSNKNQNKYRIKQIYTSPDINCQEIIEPSNITGVKIIREGTNLEIENTNLNLTKIYENYQYISENILDLSCFIENYKLYEKSTWEENDDTIIMKTMQNNFEKKLYIDKTSQNPTKMEIKDTNKNSEIYILYNKVNYQK